MPSIRKSPEVVLIRWPKLIPGRLLKRYQRFLADVRLKTGHVITAHCPNTGSMAGCCEPGRPVWLSRHDSPKRKLKYTWELIQMPESLVGINTLIPNRLVALTVAAGQIRELRHYDNLTREVKIGAHSRIDLMLSDPSRRPCFVEIKNCTLVNDGTARFPDAVTDRGRKHLEELEKLVKSGNRSVIFFFIQRMDARRFRPADQIDPTYGATLRRVVQAGVEVLAYDVAIDLKGMRIRKSVPCLL
jgi:sugar fermentation stimulation protein A